MELAGSWYYCRFFGGQCKVACDSEDDNFVTFSEIGKRHFTKRARRVGASRELLLHRLADGWWGAAVPGASHEVGLRLCRRGKELVLQKRLKSGAWSSEVKARQSPLRACHDVSKSFVQGAVAFFVAPQDDVASGSRTLSEMAADRMHVDTCVAAGAHFANVLGSFDMDQREYAEAESAFGKFAELSRNASISFEEFRRTWPIKCVQAW